MNEQNIEKFVVLPLKRNIFEGREKNFEIAYYEEDIYYVIAKVNLISIIDKFDGATVKTERKYKVKCPEQPHLSPGYDAISKLPFECGTCIVDDVYDSEQEARTAKDLRNETIFTERLNYVPREARESVIEGLNNRAGFGDKIEETILKSSVDINMSRSREMK